MYGSAQDAIDKMLQMFGTQEIFGNTDFQQILTDLYDDAFEEGYTEGHASGYDMGYDDGVKVMED